MERRRRSDGRAWEDAECLGPSAHVGPTSRPLSTVIWLNLPGRAIPVNSRRTARTAPEASVTQKGTRAQAHTPWKRQQSFGSIGV
jgi:hypothetical protein